MGLETSSLCPTGISLRTALTHFRCHCLRCMHFTALAPHLRFNRLMRYSGRISSWITDHWDLSLGSLNSFTVLALGFLYHGLELGNRSLAQTSAPRENWVKRLLTFDSDTETGMWMKQNKDRLKDQDLPN